MRVGLVVYGSLATTTGGFLYDRQLVELLRSEGASVEVIEIPWRSYPRHLADNFRPELLRRLRAAQVDVWLQDELCHPSLVGVNARLADDVPIIAIVHHLRSSEPRSVPANRVYRQIERRYLQTVDGVIANSQATRSSVTELAGVDDTSVAPPGTGRLEPEIDAAAIGSRARRPGPLRVVFVGSLIPRKGVDTLLDGLARLPAEDWTLTIVGDRRPDSSYAAGVRRQIDRLAITDRVRVTGMVTDAALGDELARAHVIAIPSRYEGFGLAYLEGMGFGLPPLATTAGGPSELITDGVDGWLVPPNDPAAVARSIATVSDDRTRLAALGRSARARYEGHPTWDESLGRARAFIEDVANV